MSKTNITFFVFFANEQLNIVSLRCFSEKSISGELYKTVFEGHNHFLVEGERLTTKMNVTFFVTNNMSNVFYSATFSKKTEFFEKIIKNNFFMACNGRLFFRKRGRLTPKINTTIFITIQLLNIFVQVCFPKKSVFSQVTAKNRFLSNFQKFSIFVLICFFFRLC